MNSLYEKLRSQVLGILEHPGLKDDETRSHALMALIISMRPDEVHMAGEKEPRIKVDRDKADGWRGRVMQNFKSANDEEIGR